MDPSLKKILAVVVLIALAYTGYSLLQCTLLSKSTKAAAPARPIKAGQVLANQYKANIQSQQKIREDLDKAITLDTNSPQKAAMTTLGVDGVYQEYMKGMMKAASRQRRAS